MSKEKIGALIRIGRRRMKWTQAELAQKVGISHSAVTQWESGQTSPTLEKWRILCELLGLEALEKEVF